MTEQGKKILKGVGITVGILLILGIGVMIYIKSTKKDEGDEDENPYAKPRQPSGNTGSNTGPTNSSSYTVNQIKQMQNWLIVIGTKVDNQVIVNAIVDSGGIDGKIGPGFRKAEAEGIRVGLFDSRARLFERSQ